MGLSLGEWREQRTGNMGGGGHDKSREVSEKVCMGYTPCFRRLTPRGEAMGEERMGKWLEKACWGLGEQEH